MATDEQDREASLQRMMHANTTMMRELLRALVEEEMLPPARAARIVLIAAETHFPVEEATGESFHLGRESLVLLANALLGWPGSEHAQRPRGPKRDLG